MGFTVPLNGRVSDHNKRKPRDGKAITQVVLAFGSIKEEQNPASKKAANYLISRGFIYGQVDENFTTADQTQLSVKIQNGNKTSSPIEGVTLADFNALAFLIGTVAVKQNWGAVAHSNLVFQYDYVEEGEALVFDDDGDIVQRDGYIDYSDASVVIANAAHREYCRLRRLPEADAPHTPPVDNKSTWQLADEARSGVYGFGDFRDLALAKVPQVHAEVNRRDGWGVDGTPLDNESKTLEQRVDEFLGVDTSSLDEDELQDWIDTFPEDVLLRAEELTVADSSGNSIAQLANATLRGALGEGKALKVRLGHYYDRVMAEVSRRLAIDKKEEVTHDDGSDDGAEHPDHDQETSGD